MSRILTAQEEIRRGIRLLELGGDELLERQRKAEDAQYEASQFLRWIDEALEAVDRERRRLIELDQTVTEKKGQIPELERAVTEATGAKEQAEAAYTAADERLRDAIRKKDRDKTQDSVLKKARDLARKERDTQKRNLVDRERKLVREKEDIKRKEGEIVKVEKRLAERSAKRDELLNAATNVQRSAARQQTEIVATVRSLWNTEASEEEAQ